MVRIEAPPPFAPLLLVNHFPDFQIDHERERELQAVVAVRFLAQRPEPHMVLAGDMDADPDAASMRFWRGLQSLEGISTCFRDALGEAHPGQPAPVTYTPDNGLMEDWWSVTTVSCRATRSGRSRVSPSAGTSRRAGQSPRIPHTLSVTTRIPPRCPGART